MRLSWIVCCLLLSSGCISLAPRSEQTGGQMSGIDSVPARRWANNTCAAGALSEVLHSLGDSITEERLSESMPRARSGGVVSVDLLLAARNRGYDAQLVKGDLPLLMEQLANGRPLILMLRVLDAPGNDKDLFHYVVLSGLDRERQLVRLHYGDGKQRWVSPEKLMSSWAAAGHATFLIGAKQKRSADDDDLRRAVLFEEEGKIREALAIYRQFTSSHPLAPHGWTNLGNAQARMGDAAAAEVSYRNALVVEPDHFDALNNLAWLLFEEKRFEEAETLARRAVAQTHPDRPLALDTLARILAARGKCAEDTVECGGSASAFERDEKAEALPPHSKRRPVWRLAAWLTAATIYDVESTFYRLKRCDECVEANALLRPFIDRGRLATYAFSAAVNAAILVIAKRAFDGGDPWWDLFGLTVSVVHAGAGTWNLVRAGRDE